MYIIHEHVHVQYMSIMETSFYRSVVSLVHVWYVAGDAIMFLLSGIM